LTIILQIVIKHQPNNRSIKQAIKQGNKQAIKNTHLTMSATTAIAADTMSVYINVSNFLYWESIAIRIDNPTLSRVQCMKNALKELKAEQMLRSFIRTKSHEIKKKYPEYTAAYCIKAALSEWKKNK